MVLQGLEEEQSLRLLLERRLEHMWQELQQSCGGDVTHSQWLMYDQLKRQDVHTTKDLYVIKCKLNRISVCNAKYTQDMRKCSESFQVGHRQLVVKRDSLLARRDTLRARLVDEQRKSTKLIKVIANCSSESCQVRLHFVSFKGLP